MEVNIMNELKEAAKSGGNLMTVFGVIAIILGMLAMLTPGLTGMSVIIMLGVLVLLGGIVRIIWAFQAGSFGKGLLMFTIGGLNFLCCIGLLAPPLVPSRVLTLLLS